MSTPQSPPTANGPLRVQFITTSLPVGGAETLLLNLVRHLDKSRFAPEVVCLKEAGELGPSFAREVPLHARWLQSKWDMSVLLRLSMHFRVRQADAVVTVGAGDKMFWGRLAAKMAGVPVICSALHSTGWPDEIGRLNRLLTPITDAFIAVAEPHAVYLSDVENLPAERIFLIPNGVDTERFRPNHTQRGWLRHSLKLSADSKLVGIVAALREEKNHVQFIDAAREVLRHHPNTHFLIVGEGPQRPVIEARISHLGLGTHIHLLGNRTDTDRILAGLDVFCLTSKNEAKPVSILESLSCGTPVVAPDIGSIAESVRHGHSGLLTRPTCAISTSHAILKLLANPRLSCELGLAGRQAVRAAWSLKSMVAGYEYLLSSIYHAKCKSVASTPSPRSSEPALPAHGDSPPPVTEAKPDAALDHVSQPSLPESATTLAVPIELGSADAGSSFVSV